MALKSHAHTENPTAGGAGRPRRFEIYEFNAALRLLGADSRWRFVGIVVIASVASALESFGVVSVFALIQAIVEPASLGRIPFLTEHVLPNIPGGQTQLLIFAAIFVAVFITAKNVVVLYATYLQQKFAYASGTEIARMLMERYILAPYEAIFKRNTSDLIVGVTQAAQGISHRILAPFVSVLTEAITVVGIGAVLVYSEPVITVYTCGALAVLMTIYYLAMRRMYGHWGREQLDIDRGTTKCVYESLNSLKEIKVLSRESYFLDVFAALQARRVRNMVISSTANATPRLITETLAAWVIATMIMLVLMMDRPTTSLISTLGRVGARVPRSRSAQRNDQSCRPPDGRAKISVRSSWRAAAERRSRARRFCWTRVCSS